MFRSGNPTLKDNTFDIARSINEAAMTMNGVVQKSAIVLACAVGSAFYTWGQLGTALETQDDTAISRMMMWLIGSLIGGLVLALVTVFKKQWSPITAPLYGLVQGVVIGSVSIFAELRFPGIVIQAVGLTFGVFAALLIAYSSGWIRATENFKLMVFSATAGIMVVYLVGFGLSFFGKQIPYIHESGIIGIGFSLFVVAIAAMNLVLDFDFIERGVEHQAPKYLEWYAAFALTVTLIWLYFEILRLLQKLRSR